MYLVVSILFFLSTYGYARILSFEPLFGIYAGFTVLLFSMPFHSPPLFSPSYWWHAPFWQPTVYSAAAIIISFSAIGRFGYVISVAASALFVGAIFLLMLSAAKLAPVVILGCVIVCSASLTAAKDRRERIWKMGVVALSLSALLFFGPADYLKGLFLYSTNGMLEKDVSNSGLHGLIESLFFRVSPIEVVPLAMAWVKLHFGYALPVGGLAGMVVALGQTSVSTRLKRVLAVFLLAMSGALLLMPYGVVIAGSLFPLYVIFALSFLRSSWRFVGTLFMRLRLITWGGSSSSRQSAIVASFCFALAVVAIGGSVRPSGFRYPPDLTFAVSFLQEKIRFKSGDVFAGRYHAIIESAELDGGMIDHLPAEDRNLASSLVQGAAKFSGRLGNDLMYSGVRFFDIPVATELNRMATPFAMLAINRLLVRPNDVTRIDFRQISRFDPRLMAMLGIRFVASHRRPDGAGIHEVGSDLEWVRERPEIRMYEIDAPNLGNYSPTRIFVEEKFDSILERMAPADFNPQAEAVVDSSWGDIGDLVPATSARIQRVGGRLKIEAISKGRSLLVLPFEYSRCIQVIKSTSRPPLHIGRTDFFLTGVLFEENVSIELEFRFGPFVNSSCRLDDYNDAMALGINSQSFQAYTASNQQYFRITGIF